MLLSGDEYKNKKKKRIIKAVEPEKIIKKRTFLQRLFGK